MSIVALLLCILAFGLFGLATDPHHQRLVGRRLSPPVKARMRLGAWASIALAFVFATMSSGWIFGPVVWAGEVMLGAGIAFLALNFIPVRHASPERAGTHEKGMMQ